MHHDETKGVQKEFKKSVLKLAVTITEMGNPFLETSTDLLVLDSRDIVDAEVAGTIEDILSVGKKQYEEFLQERLFKRSTSLFSPITKNKFPLFSCPVAKKSSKEKQRIATLKVSLFSRLYVSCQVREGDLDDFFCHENHSFPPSISQHGNLRLGSKSDLLEVLENCRSYAEEPKNMQVVILDGPAIVNMLKPVACQAFAEYAEKVFLKYLAKQLEAVDRLDIVWDIYVQDSLKSTTRSKCGKGSRRRVQPTTRVPTNWHEFLRVDDNKTELFAYLADQSISISDSKQIVSAKGESAICNQDRFDLTSVAPCKQEEADTRILLHAKDAVMQGYERILIRTVDTDVIVLD